MRSHSPDTCCTHRRRTPQSDARHLPARPRRRSTTPGESPLPRSGLVIQQQHRLKRMSVLRTNSPSWHGPQACCLTGRAARCVSSDRNQPSAAPIDLGGVRLFTGNHVCARHSGVHGHRNCQLFAVIKNRNRCDTAAAEHQRTEHRGSPLPHQRLLRIRRATEPQRQCPAATDQRGAGMPAGNRSTAWVRRLVRHRRTRYPSSSAEHGGRTGVAQLS